MNINRLIKDLKIGNNPEENLSAYSQLLLNSYIRLAYGRFALDFTENYDFLAQEEEGFVFEVLSEITSMARDLGEGKTDAKPEDIEKLERIRGRVMTALKELEEYLYYFQFYEHTMNRLAFKFEDKLDIPDTQELVAGIMMYISEKEDAPTVNQRIQTVLSELPVRLTTAKFFELLDNGCMCFNGARSDMADSFFEQMELAAKKPELGQLNESWPELYRNAKLFDGLSFDMLDQETCNALLEKLELTAKVIAKHLGNFVDLLDLINELYILVISLPYTMAVPAECQELGAILRAYIKAVDSGDFLDIDEDILGGLSKTVENQEKYLGEHMYMEDALESILEKHSNMIDGIMLGGIYHALCIDQRLFSPNSTKDISQIAPYYIVGREEIISRTNALKAIYKKTFKENPQIVKRSLISRAFENIPVPFDNLNGVEEFIRQSLYCCTQDYEKAAVASALENMIK